MKLRNVCFVLSMALASGGIFANPPVTGHGTGKATFGPTTGSMPPGLQNKGTPPGLYKHNKTPAGWSKGHKTGWKHQNIHGQKTHGHNHGHNH